MNVQLLFFCSCTSIGSAAVLSNFSKSAVHIEARGHFLNINTRSCPTDIEGLENTYDQIFPTGNRNAASFKWFKYVADCASEVGEAAFETLGKGFCPISGSPIPGDNIAKVMLSSVDGGESSGLFFFCCDPCICDMIDFVRVDSKTISSKQYDVLVIGDPCKNKEKLLENYTDPFSGNSTNLQAEAPEIQCDGDQLQGAAMSDAGHPIIGLFYPEETATATIDGTTSNQTTTCSNRANAGYNSGMGMIFRKVAGINPI